MIVSRAFTVSVVIPLFNKESSIAATLASVLRQSRLPDEIIVIDDGSTDASAEVARATLSASSDIRWRLLSQTNSGVSAARNRGAGEAGADYVAFLDADDEWLPEYLAEIEKLATAFPSAGVLTTRNFRTDGIRMRVTEPSPLPDGYFGMLDRPLAIYRRGRGIIHSSSATIQKQCWDRSGGFPVGAVGGEDLYLWWKLALTETFAHSGIPLSVRHQEHSTLQNRKGLVPYHVEYFLGTAQGRELVRSHADLRKLLGSNLAKQIGTRRLMHDPETTRLMVGFSSSLPLAERAKCLAISKLPLRLLKRLIGNRAAEAGRQIRPE